MTNDAERVVASIHEFMASLKHRRVYYLDSMNQIDELRHQQGRFVCFGAFTADDQLEILSAFPTHHH